MPQALPYMGSLLATSPNHLPASIFEFVIEFDFFVNRCGGTIRSIVPEWMPHALVGPQGITSPPRYFDGICTY
jgi:hypothetical protein